MVVSLGPGKFYGSSLPRPHIYTDVKFNSDRVDPPVSVMDPFLSWAEEAHWSMGGLSFNRLRHQGRIEGNVNKLRKFKEKQAKAQSGYSPKAPTPNRVDGKKENTEKKRSRSISPPPAPKVAKRSRFMDLFDEEEEEEEVIAVEKKKKPARKLVGDFEKVADQTPVGVQMRRSSGEDGVGDLVMKVVEDLNIENSMDTKEKRGKKGKTEVQRKSSSPFNGIRVSPRLAKRRSS